jgi:uncharacterized protein (DUF1501 family)
MSEFGRTAKENGNRGTDHGHANCMFVMGGEVRGGGATIASSQLSILFGGFRVVGCSDLILGSDANLTKSRTMETESKW